MALPSNVCDRCGYAHGVKRVMLMVEGRPMNEHKLCLSCLGRVFDVLQTRVAEKAPRVA
jgi:hypothetical protein